VTGENADRKFDGAGRIKRLRATDALAATLRRQIVDGDLGEGDRLPNESELETAYGVSRPTVRQALSMLEREGLIVVRHGTRGGALVRRPSIGVAARYVGYVLQSRGVHVADVFAMRLRLEPPVIRELAERHSDSDVQALRELIAAERTGGYDPIEAPERFRLTLAERSPNVASAVMLGLFGELGRQQSLLARKRWPEKDLERFARIGHARRSELVDLIEAGDADGAEALWREYLLDTQRVIGRELLATRVDVLDVP